MPSQSPLWRSRFDVTVEQAEHEVYAVEPEGRAFAGAAAANRVLKELGGKYARIARWYQFAPVRLLEDLAYPVIARYRGLLSRWGDMPACDEPDAGCL
jgi:predicted DCC family thiol-disulfide oxidoreductase YuxK